MLQNTSTETKIKQVFMKIAEIELESSPKLIPEYSLLIDAD